MKNLGRGLFLLLALVSYSTVATADCAKAKPGLLKAADVLLDKTEQLDTQLHTYKASDDSIKTVHHFEEHIGELIAELQKGMACEDAIDEFQHFHEDVQLMYKSLSANKDVFYVQAKDGSMPVLNAWNSFLPAFIRFQNRLYY